MSKAISDMSIFGEYAENENRATAALLQVLRAGGEPLLREAMGTIGIQLPSNEIAIISQPLNPSGASTPDGLLKSKFSFNLYIESKLKSGQVKQNNIQLEEHKKAIRTINDYLLYVTPDSVKPVSLENVFWINWRSLTEIFENYINDSHIENHQLLSFLVVEFRKLVDNFNLSPYTWENYEDSDQVLILAGSWAEGIACKYNYYICQNNRSFRPSRYIAFYNNSKISHLFRVASLPEDDVDIASDTRFTQYIANEEPELGKGDKRKVIPLEYETELNIENDKIDKNGRPCPFSYGQPRYTTSERVMKARYTSEL